MAGCVSCYAFVKAPSSSCCFYPLLLCSEWVAFATLTLLSAWCCVCFVYAFGLLPWTTIESAGEACVWSACTPET